MPLRSLSLLLDGSFDGSWASPFGGKAGRIPLGPALPSHEESPSCLRSYPVLLLALLALLASLLLLLAPALLLAFLSLLASAAGEPAYDALGLVSHTSYGVLRPLDGLTRLVRYLSRGILRPSALLLLLLAFSALGL